MQTMKVLHRCGVGGHWHGLGELVHQDLGVAPCKKQGQGTEELPGHHPALWVIHVKQRGLLAMSDPANSHCHLNG